MMKKFWVIIVSFICLFVSCKDSSEWINSNLAGNISKKQPLLKDDFYQHVNYDWFKENGVILPEEDGKGPLLEARKNIQNQVLEMVRDDEKFSHEEEIVDYFYRQIANNDNAASLEKANGIINELLKISSVSKYWETVWSEFLPDCTIFSYYFNNINPQNSNLFLPVVQPSYVFGSLDNFFDSDSEESIEVFSLHREYYGKFLQTLGWSESEALKLVEKAFEFEMRLLEKDSADLSSNIYTEDRVGIYFPNLPVYEILRNKGGKYELLNLYDTEAFTKCNELFLDENIDSIKSLAVCTFLSRYAPYISKDCENLFFEILKKLEKKERDYSEDEKIVLMINPAEDIISQGWYNRYFDKRIIPEIEDFTKKVIRIYKNKLNSADWISEMTKSKACMKLDSIKIDVAVPERLNDYSDFMLDTECLLDSAILIKRNNEKNSIELSSDYNKKDSWLNCLPITVNAFYNPNYNSIVICAGYLNDFFYNMEWSVEKKMAHVGIMIGHEISHAFDLNGGVTDPDGNYILWWDRGDYNTLVEKCRSYGEYVSSKDYVSKEKAVNQLYWGEIVSDAGGLSVMLDLAKEYENFDYDAFFREFASGFRLIGSKAYIDNASATDVHSMYYIRVNATLQLFDEFYETYGIKNGDGMYLAPEKRIKIW